MENSELNHPLLRKIAAEKTALCELWEMGEITATEFQEQIDDLAQQERGICMEVDRRRLLAVSPQVHVSKLLPVFLILAFLLGFIVSPALFPKLFGYKTAQECVLAHGSSRVALKMCYDLYSSSERED